MHAGRMSQTIVDLVTILLPQAHSSTSNPNNDLASCIQAYINKADESGNLSIELTGKEVHEAFYLCCIDYLEKLSRITPDPTAPADILLSVTREQQLRKCIEFLICLGAYPLLDRGVGLPLNMRLESIAYNCPTQSNCPDRCSKLLKIAQCLLLLRESKHLQLNRLISPELFLGDLVACLAQTAHGPVGLAPLVDEKLLLEERKASLQARKLLWKLLCNLPGHAAMKELLVLQGGATGGSKVKGAVQLPPAPRWLQKICGGLLSRLVARPSGQAQASTRSGVKDLLLAMASLAPGIISSTSPAGCINSLDPRLQPAVAQAVANILTSTPSFVLNSTEEAGDSARLKYNATIATQILDLFDLKEHKQSSLTDQNSMSGSLVQFGHLVALTTVHEFCSRNADLGKELYLSPLIGVLHRFVIDCADNLASEVTETLGLPDSTDECELATVSELRHTLDVLSDLISVPTPSLIVMHEAIKLSKPLFRLLVQIHEDSNDVDAAKHELPTSSSQHIDRTSALKSLLITIFTRLLSCATESRADRLHILRQWLELPPSTLLFGSKSNPTTTNKQEVCPFLIFSCHPRLKFRPPQPVHILEDAHTNDKSHPVPDFGGYRAVLTRQDVYLADQPEKLPSLVSALIDLLHAANPRKPKPDESEDQEVPRFQTVTIDHDNSVRATDDDVSKHGLSTISADLFLSLIADLNDNLRFIFQRRLPDLCILPVNESKDDTVRMGAKTGLLSSLLAAAMLDCLGDQIWPEDPAQVVNLFEMTLTRLHMLVSGRIEAELKEFFLETLSQILGILAFYAQQLKPGTTDTMDEFGRLLPILSELENAIRAHSVMASRAQLELLHCIRVMLATRGAVHLTEDKFDSTPASVTPLDSFSSVKMETQTSHKFVEEIPEADVHLPPATAHNDESLDPELREAFEQLRDPLVPVRGHALISLSRLLESRHKSIAGNEERIFQVLFRHLSDEDSYIYLNAIRGLAALGHALTDRVLGALLERFRQLCITSSVKTSTQPTSPDGRVEFILKLGEAIMRILRDLGDMAPKYRTQVLHCMTVGSRDSEPLVRAASLSNVSELCRLLRHAVGPVVYEVFSLIEIHLTQDQSPSVRQAAAHLARAFFLDEQLPDWLAPDVLRDLHRLLSNRSKIERDSGVLEQIEAALAQLDKCARSSVFLKPLTPESLLKEIRISKPF